MRGQSALDGFDPNANNVVLAVVVQLDGKILIGGSFTTLSPNGGGAVTRNRIARLNPDGTLDTAFNPNANSDVNAIALQADGKILMGGFFTTLSPNGGAPVTRNRIARLNPDGTLDTTFDPNASGSVRALAVQPDGKILAGGQFTTIGGATRNRFARLDPATGTADSFDPNANNTVFAIAVQPDGKILAGGLFNGTNSIGGQTRNRIARLDPSTGLADAFDPNASGGVFAIALQADGKILAGGSFQRSEQHRRAGAEPDRAARSQHGSGGSLQPERELSGPCHRGAAGREDSRGRRFQRSEQHRRSGAQQHRAAGSDQRSGGLIRPEGEQSGQRLCHRLAAGRQGRGGR